MFAHTFSFFTRIYQTIADALQAYANAIPPLILRLVLAWEFGEAGFEKLNGANWFADIVFPFPLNVLPPELSWTLALTFEIVGAIALLFGVATRFFAFALLILTVVAIAAVHWPQEWATFSELLAGYRIIDETGDGFGNYKLPLIYMVMLLPIIFGGAGKWSVDELLKKHFSKKIGKNSCGN